MTFDSIVSVLLIAASPIAELRAALPVAIHVYHFPWPMALLVSIVGNLIPIPFILLLLNPAARIAARIRPLNYLLQLVFRYTRRRSALVKKYERVGLALFVAIPLPVSGAWTGAIIAYLLELKFYYAFFSIIVGVLIAGVVVTALSLLGWTGALIAGVALAVLVVSGLWKYWNKPVSKV